jgi:hypothetical protein|tara:strand:- start:1959 stop:2492 length:534 start_codon:yes stop_codon:yes gene_type:complete
LPNIRRKKKSETLGIALNAAITFAGIILLGFIYSFSQNQLHDGVQIKSNISSTPSQPILAKDIYIQNPVENIKVEVLNGCGVSSLAAKTTDFLRTKQIDVIMSDNADHHNYEKTLIIQRNEKVKSLKKIVEAFGIYIKDSTRVQILPDESLGVDVTVILGQDYTSFAELNNYISAKY